MIHVYDAVIVCKTCGFRHELAVFSWNPNKKTYTFKERGLDSVQRLPCGHLQDLEGHPVTPHREEPGQ